jgi:hypothetical protein
MKIKKKADSKLRNIKMQNNSFSDDDHKFGQVDDENSELRKSFGQDSSIMKLKKMRKFQNEVDAHENLKKEKLEL